MPSLVKVIIQGADPGVIVGFQVLTSCEQLKSLTVKVTEDFLEDGVILPDAASISMTRCSTPAPGLLEVLFIHQGCIVPLVH